MKILIITLLLCFQAISQDPEVKRVPLEDHFIQFGLEEEFLPKRTNLLPYYVLPMAAIHTGLEIYAPGVASIIAPFAWVGGTITAKVLYVNDIDLHNQKKRFSLALLIEKQLSYLPFHHPYYCVRDYDRLTFPNIDWWIELTKDNMVIEIKSKPKPSGFFLNHQDFIQTYVYDLFKKNKYKPRKVFGMGHLNLGGTWIHDANLVRNFIIDYANHSELYNGALYFDTYRKYGAQPTGISLKDREAMRWFLERTRGEKDAQIVLKLAKAMLNTRGKHAHYTIEQNEQGQLYIELRAVRTKKNAHELFLYTQLFEKRLEYLSQFLTPIEYYKAGAIMSYQQGMNQFYLYVKQAKLDWGIYKEILPKFWNRFQPDEDIIEIAKHPNSMELEPLFPQKIFTYNPRNKMPLKMQCSMLFLNR